MRELKFRFVDKVNGTVYKPITLLELCLRIEMPRRIVLESENGDFVGTEDFLDQLEKGELIIEQDTGLKDKNGKEICEGDIVRIVSESFLEPSVGIVGFDEDNGIYDTYITENNKVYWEAGSCLCSLMGREDYTTEVIGNIHENPDLLEEMNVD